MCENYADVFLPKSTYLASYPVKTEQKNLQTKLRYSNDTCLLHQFKTHSKNQGKQDVVS